MKSVSCESSTCNLGLNKQLTTSQFTNNIAALGALATAVAASNPIVVKGQDFIDSVTDKRFMVLGVDYQEGGAGADFSESDPLTNATRCTRDAALMQVSTLCYCLTEFPWLLTKLS